jgi:hypothetical protein
MSSVPQVKPIPGFPGYYAVDTGQIWSAKTGRYLRQSRASGNHRRVNLSREDGIHREAVHVLILETFVGPCPKGLEGCHRDGDGANNRLDNLRWDTHQANVMDAVRHGTCSGFKNKGEHNGQAWLTDQQVRDIDLLYRSGGCTQRELANRYKVSDTAIWKIVHRKKWKHLWT